LAGKLAFEMVAPAGKSSRVAQKGNQELFYQMCVLLH
jgi:hypothetical protein